jgi:hypothetical protein
MNQKLGKRRRMPALEIGSDRWVRAIMSYHEAGHAVIARWDLGGWHHRDGQAGRGYSCGGTNGLGPLFT